MITYSRRNLDFLLYEVEEILKITAYPYFQAHNRETFSFVLDTAEGIAEKHLRPYLKESDLHPPELIHNRVNVHPALKEFYKSFCDNGLMSASFAEKYGGQQLPKTVYGASDFIIGNGHNGFEMFTGLASAAARLLITFGSDELVDHFALKILSGEYTATMCLTETQAGSSLSDVVTIGIPQSDGTYKIKGQKIFISAGDHDITDTIVHLVLARTPGAPSGTKGLSLFAVPTSREVDGHIISNDVTSIGIYHKMGQKSTPAMHLEFGAKDDCIGYIIGEEHKGLEYMFQMMNASRLGVGMAGTYIASSAYYHSLQYAQERIQGKRMSSNQLVEPCPIIQHPDVRRMLFFQKAMVEGSLAFIFYCFHLQDLEQVSTGDERLRYNNLLELLTPVAKTFGAEMGIQSVQNGMQVLGGYGYTDDFILEQLARDIRIMSIYEGTTGIQAQALLGRQIPLQNGRSLQYWKDEVMKDIINARDSKALGMYAGILLEEILQLESITKHLLSIAQKNSTEIFLRDATLYMEYFGIINVAWHWLRQGAAAHRALGQ
jgi:butyryl-CoA dehydrogenase